MPLSIHWRKGYILQYGKGREIPYIGIKQPRWHIGHALGKWSFSLFLWLYCYELKVVCADLALYCSLTCLDQMVIDHYFRVYVLRVHCSCDICNVPIKKYTWLEYLCIWVYRKDNTLYDTYYMQIFIDAATYWFEKDI